MRASSGGSRVLLGLSKGHFVTASGTDTMNQYDPAHTPDPEQWLALDEQERIDLVEAHHRAVRAKLPNAKMHAAFHAIVENQLAENLEPVVRAMDRLRAGGLMRHDSIHAIASVVAKQLYELAKPGAEPADAQTLYVAAVERLTARSWRDG